jgi:hypothetical protein
MCVLEISNIISLGIKKNQINIAPNKFRDLQCNLNVYYMFAEVKSNGIRMHG